jgi:hypothetical protein
MAGLLENKKKLDREIRNMEALLDGSKNKVFLPDKHKVILNMQNQC